MVFACGRSRPMAADGSVRPGRGPGASNGQRGGGLISAFARHPTAPNLAMVIFILLGVFALDRLNRQFFPDFEVPAITVTVAWPGASAEDTEANILDVLEPELRFIDNIEEVSSYARDGSATITLEFSPTADMQKAQSDVEQAVSRVTTLPEDAEQPIISRATLYDPIADIRITGPFSERVLKGYAKKLRDGLLNAGIDSVVLTGARDEEIWVKVREEELRRLGLTLDEVARVVRENTQDQPAGILEGESELQLRAKSDRKTPEAIAELEIKSLPTGQKVLLRDVADVSTRFERNGVITVSQGQKAVGLRVQRALTADTLETMKIMKDYLAQSRPEYPPSLDIKVYNIRGELVEQRLGILITNGLQGLVLVLVALFVFLNARVAFWTAAGIPVALLATLFIMWLSGQSINMVSMFALIMMLGIIVDDAIVVGEHASTLEDRGTLRLAASQQAAHTMFAPVTAASLTTAAAFLPMFFIADRIGDILLGIPLVVFAALLASLIECFLILPGHLRHGRTSAKGPSRMRRAIDGGVDFLRERLFGPFVRVAYDWRYTTVAVLIASFILALGMMAGGRVKFVFFPRLEPETILASVNFAPGVPRDQQIAAVTRIEAALYEAEKALLERKKKEAAGAAISSEPKETNLVEASLAVIGKSGRSQGDNLAEISGQLTPSEVRSIRTNEVLREWRGRIPPIAGVERVAVFGQRAGPPGRDVDVRLQSGTIETLKAAAEDLKQRLTAFAGVSAIEDDLPYGKQELVFTLTPRGRALGFTDATVGRQLRNAFEGAIATRFARGDEEITVRVSREQELAGIAALENVYLSTQDGTRVPLSEVVDIRERQNFALVRRSQGVRTVAVTADLDTDIATTEEILDRLEKDGIMADLTDKYGITYYFSGRDEERRESFKDLQSGSLLALALIYIILAWVFASYAKPFAVMAIIPFGFVGAVAGHYIMGYDITIISMIGLLGLTGILVNDSIVLVSRLGQRLRAGDDLRLAAIGAAKDRLRAVILTSLTTIGGLTPLIFETSRQAQFLIPLAITIVFGLAGATVLVLVLVPALVGIGGDIGALAGRIQRLYISPRAEPAE
jgi:multidrug efflux pump subunit AcrB